MLRAATAFRVLLSTYRRYISVCAKLTIRLHSSADQQCGGSAQTRCIHPAKWA